ncbi:hypothetical protein LZ318_11790 [Saccharopolyspora indica]|uniref:hypothetical protein n=1 Tax=Saccharopolyspora indica TaxID=1229659 RepID=UPI0022EAA055|nr:hypothetical protein [Saccharopolyspora indica]MDA3643807.1 hypothetical protein [Saccharopolyspora indica]
MTEKDAARARELRAAAVLLRAAEEPGPEEALFTVAAEVYEDGYEDIRARTMAAAAYGIAKKHLDKA